MSGWIAATLLAASTAAFQAPQPEPRSGVDEVWVEVAGRSIRALCTSSAPTVLFLHDAGADADDWRSVLEHLDTEAGACVYQRAATGGETGEVAPRGWFELFEELRGVHDALGARPGYVLVGQGVGAMYARLFASTRPGAVGGLLLIEPSHEDLPQRLMPAMPAAAWTRWMALRKELNPDGVREAELAARARRTRVPGGIPMTVITATSRPVAEGWDERFVDEAARQAHESLVRGRAYGRHVPARAYGPDVARDQPSLVAEEIERVLRIAGSS
ncbi:MAG: alpha/beta hydrolase [Gemmatimonadota bacterium]